MKNGSGRHRLRRLCSLNQKQIADGFVQTAWAFCYATSLHGLRHLADDIHLLNNTKTKRTISQK